MQKHIVSKSLCIYIRRTGGSTETGNCTHCLHSPRNLLVCLQKKTSSSGSTLPLKITWFWTRSSQSLDIRYPCSEPIVSLELKGNVLSTKFSFDKIVLRIVNCNAGLIQELDEHGYALCQKLVLVYVCMRMKHHARMTTIQVKNNKQKQTEQNLWKQKALKIFWNKDLFNLNMYPR